MNNYEIENLLKNSINNKRILHSYMFIGGKFSSKEEIAIKFAKNILCIENKSDACEQCDSCIKFNSGNHPDFQILKLNENESTLKIEQIRELQNDIIKKPIVSNRKVYIIENADKMTTSSQNCLLKTLEEPPLYVTIILLVENENSILNTIKSRCTKINFTQETIEKLSEEEKAIYKELEKVFKNISNLNILDVLDKLDMLYKNEENIFKILDYINIILYKNIEKDKRSIKYIEYIEETKQRLKSNANFKMSIDNLLYNIWQD